MTSLPAGYLHKIYAGVLGKLIGVYLGRPFENWTYRQILEKLGPVYFYVHDQLGVPLVVIDDDVSGTFAFVRALEEHGAKPDLSPEEVGQTWLNNVIEKRTIFWWGGNGISTEHTAFCNLKKGIMPPLSGSMRTNGQTLAEQIGAQIFIDGWAMVAPGNPALATKLAEVAARVSHDGVAVHAARLWAAMEAQAFVSKNVDHLLDTGLSFIPSDSPITRLVADIRAWAKEDRDWEKTRQRIEDNYGYDKYGGICHMIPNHGIMIMALIYGGHDFSHAMHIINTSGWDTDCNSGNIGCLVAIMHGLAAFQNEKGLDWRGALADRALISSADNSYSINNAVRLTYDLANLARKLVGEKPLDSPKEGAQFHFSLPGSVQGFQVTTPPNIAVISQGEDAGTPALSVQLIKPNESSGVVEVLTQTFTPLEVLQVNRDYEMMASPLVYPGQKVVATVRADDGNDDDAFVRLRTKAYDFNDDLITVDSETQSLNPGKVAKLEWTIPQSLENKPIQQLGIAIGLNSTTSLQGKFWLHSIKYSGTPCMTLRRPPSSPAKFWQRAWVSSVHKVHGSMGPSFYMAHDQGEGLFTQGTRDWTDYTASVAKFTINLGGPSGIAIRVQNLNRYYSLKFFKGGYVAIVKARDKKRIELNRINLQWEIDVAYEIEITAKGKRIRARIDDVDLEAEDDEYQGGAVGFVVGEGSISADSIKIGPI